MESSAIEDVNKLIMFHKKIVVALMILLNNVNSRFRYQGSSNQMIFLTRL